MASGVRACSSMVARMASFISSRSTRTALVQSPVCWRVQGGLLRVRRALLDDDAAAARAAGRHAGEQVLRGVLPGPAAEPARVEEQRTALGLPAARLDASPQWSLMIRRSSRFAFVRSHSGRRLALISPSRRACASDPRPPRRGRCRAGAPLAPWTGPSWDPACRASNGSNHHVQHASPFCKTRVPRMGPGELPRLTHRPTVK